MTIQQAINKLAEGNREHETVKIVAQAVAQQSNRGEWYNGNGSTNVYDWIAEGDIDSGTTVAALVTEWDAEDE